MAWFGRRNDVADEKWQPLRGVRVIEAGSFVAVPLAGMTLAQLGAEVIRVDPPDGGSDIRRWPLAPSGGSLFWANLNKGKRSVTIDHRTPQGRELLLGLATAAGEGNGIFLDNMVGRRSLSFADLSARRSDVIHLRVQGRPNGRPAVDYTVNAEVGVPQMTGSADLDAPVNHVVPAWDLMTGSQAVMLVCAALDQRRRTGEGSEIALALEDVAITGVASMGWLAEADLAGAPRARHGNHMFGSFGVDFETSDHERIMVVALTEGQWRALREVTGTGAVFAALEQVLGADLDLEADRYRYRETIASVLRPWFAGRSMIAVKEQLEAAHVLYSRYRTLDEAARAFRAEGRPLVAEVDQPGIGPSLATGSSWRADGGHAAAQPAPALGEDCDDVLSDVLGLGEAERAALRRDGVIG